MNRRELLKGMAVTSVVAATTQRVWADNHESNENMVEYLFVQNANKVSLTDSVLMLIQQLRSRLL